MELLLSVANAGLIITFFSCGQSTFMQWYSVALNKRLISATVHAGTLVKVKVIWTKVKLGILEKTVNLYFSNCSHVQIWHHLENIWCRQDAVDISINSWLWNIVQPKLFAVAIKHFWNGSCIWSTPIWKLCLIQLHQLLLKLYNIVCSKVWSRRSFTYS